MRQGYREVGMTLRILGSGDKARDTMMLRIPGGRGGDDAGGRSWHTYLCMQHCQ